MNVRRLVGGLLLSAVTAASPSSASPAPPTLTVDKTFGKVEGWSIGYSESLSGCLAAATYSDGTTIWFGFGGARSTSYLAFTNPKWNSIQVGNQYDIKIYAQGRGRWHGTFTGFARDDSKGLFQAGLKDNFVTDLSNAGAIGVEFEGRKIASLSLVGSTEALDAVLGCQKDYAVARTKTSGPLPLSQPDQDNSEKSSQGTGFFVSDKGHVLTNNHVVEGCTDISITQIGSPPIKARLVGSDSTNDLALLSTDGRPAAVPPLSTRARVGDNVYAYGFPLNGILATNGNFTVGNVTALAGLGDDTREIQISVPVQPGNSGGPLVDQYGNVVGECQ